jgi:dolichyl-phosphate beta-glucosyltransferase
MSTIPLPTAASDPDLTVILPARNEARRLPRSLSSLRRFLTDWGVDYQVLVVDDGSTDGTSAVAESLGPRFGTLRLDEQCGKGRAVRAGMLRATGGVLAFTDADLPYDLAALRDGFERIRCGECRVAFGARDLSSSRCLVHRRWSRKISSAAFHLLTAGLISREVRDTQCGLKVFERRAAREIFSRSTIDGFAFDCEVVLLTKRLGLPYCRIPVALVNDDASTVSLSADAMPTMIDVFRLVWRSRGGLRPDGPRHDSELSGISATTSLVKRSA